MKLQSAIFLLSLMLLTSCGIITGRVHDRFPDIKELLSQQETVNILSSLKSTNSGLKAFKGIGGIRLTDLNSTSTARMAWCGSVPDKLRVTVLVAGQPSETLTADGRYLCILSHTGQHPFIKKRSAKPSLEKLISIPIRTDDVISLIAGRVPVYNHDRAICYRPKDGDGYILALLKNRRGIIEKIYLDEDRSGVRGAEIFSGGNSLVYRAEFAKMKNMSGFLVPVKLILSGDKGVSVTLAIDRYMPNTPVTPSLFILPHP